MVQPIFETHVTHQLYLAFSINNIGFDKMYTIPIQHISAIEVDYLQH